MAAGSKCRGTAFGVRHRAPSNGFLFFRQSDSNEGLLYSRCRAYCFGRRTAAWSYPPKRTGALEPRQQRVTDSLPSSPRGRFREGEPERLSSNTSVIYFRMLRVQRQLTDQLWPPAEAAAKTPDAAPTRPSGAPHRGRSIIGEG